MIIKTSNLTGAALDWAVSVLEGYQPVYTDGSLTPVFRKGEAVQKEWPSFSTDVVKGTTIIFREGISLLFADNNVWGARPKQDGITSTNDSFGETPLIAGLRCYVTSVHGKTVRVPDELTK